MSVEELTAFVRKLESDEGLRQQAAALQNAGGAERIDGLCRLAAEHGFDVSPADWEHEAAGPAVAALSEDALGTVVGAGCENAAGIEYEQSLGASLGSCE